MYSLDNIPTARDIANDKMIDVLDGVFIRPLRTNDDARGAFTELFRDEWHLGAEPRQWNMVRSNANVLRGVHAHRLHADYLTMAAGEMVLALKDLRRRSITNGATLILRLQAEDLHLVVIPIGVAHGFYFPQPACHIYAVSRPHDGTDEFGCHWADPALGFAWSVSDPELSARDRMAGTYDDLVRSLAL